MGGCILWEYGDTGINPVEWAIDYIVITLY